MSAYSFHRQKTSETPHHFLPYWGGESSDLATSGFLHSNLRKKIESRRSTRPLLESIHYHGFKWKKNDIAIANLLDPPMSYAVKVTFKFKPAEWKLIPKSRAIDSAILAYFGKKNRSAKCWNWHSSVITRRIWLIFRSTSCSSVIIRRILLFFAQRVAHRSSLGGK